MRTGRALLLLLALVLAQGPVLANPEGGTVTAGDAAISGEGTARVLVTQSSQRALIDWQGFSIGAGRPRASFSPMRMRWPRIGWWEMTRRRFSVPSSVASQVIS